MLRNAARPGTLRAAGTGPAAQTPTGKARVRVGRETAGRAGKGVSVISGLPLGKGAAEETLRRGWRHQERRHRDPG
ncbi:MAG TPA: hypothetical protein VN869_06610 [Steroidobacteraceae bacterium]|nr:hypothetical protein [Steroidobacteraceae bacterium]